MAAALPEEKPTQPQFRRARTPLPESIQLMVVSGPDIGVRAPIGELPCIVGKSHTCDLVLRDRAVSRRHLEVTLVPNAVRLRDLNSKNGSYLSEIRFSSVDVTTGAVVCIGSTELKIAPAHHHAALPPSSQASFMGLCGGSLPMRQVYAILECIGPSEASVLIQGETGTGKDLVAEAIHRASRRLSGPFVVCDSAHVAPAFLQAEGGTLYLDEVGELDLFSQGVLLRALDRRGNVRVVAASSRDLAGEVKAGRFRLELYHRLAVVRIDLPPLRERREDIPMLVAEFVGEDAFPADVMARLCAHDWPGNVRELRNVVERAHALGGLHGEI
jgi:two-component system, NtrC family, response regulator